MTAQIALTVARKMFVRLLVSGIIIGLCILVMQLNLAIGILLMMLYSSLMVIKSSRKEMPLGKFTAILPGLMSLASFLFMLILIGVHNPLMPVIGLAAGIIPGWLMARGHRIYEKNGVVYAKRTFFYIFIWVLSLLFTQGSTLAGMREITDFGFLLNGFSTAMMVVLSSILIKKVSASFRMIRSKGISVSILLLLIPFLTFNLVSFPVDADGQNQNTLSLELRNRPRRPAGDSLMSDTERITNQENLQQYQQTFRNRNVARTAEQRDRAIKYSGLNNDCGEFLSKEYREKLYNQHVKSKLAKWGNMRWKHHSVGAESKNLRILPKYKASLPIWMKRVSCIDNCVAQEFHYETEWSACRSKCYNKKYIKCKKVTPQSDPSPSISTDSPSDSASHFTAQTQDSSAFSDTLTDMTSEEHLDALSFDNIMNNDNEVEPEPIPNPAPYPDPKKPDQDDFLSAIKKALRDFGFKDDDAAAAGVAVALMMLLGGMGMNAALTAAQETANVFMAAAQETATDTSSGPDDSSSEGSSTKILDGDEAIAWMKDDKNGYLDHDGKPTDKFHEFMNAMPSDPVKMGLRGMSFKVDKDGKNIGNYVIIVDDKATQASQADNNTIDTDETPADDEKDKGGGGADSIEGGGKDEGTGEDEVVVGPPIDYLIQVKEEEISLKEKEIRRKEQNLNNLDADIKTLQKEKEISSEVEKTNSIINLIDFTLGTFANISTPSWFLDFQKSVHETFVRYENTGELPSYGDFKKYLKKQAKEYIVEKSGTKIKTPEESWGELWDTTCSGAYSKLKEFHDYRETEEKRSNQLESRRTRYREDKAEIEKLKDELTNKKDQLDLLRIKKG